MTKLIFYKVYIVDALIACILPIKLQLVTIRKLNEKVYERNHCQIILISVESTVFTLCVIGDRRSRIYYLFDNESSLQQRLKRTFDPKDTADGRVR